MAWCTVPRFGGAFFILDNAVHHRHTIAILSHTTNHFFATTRQSGRSTAKTNPGEKARDITKIRTATNHIAFLHQLPTRYLMLPRSILQIFFWNKGAFRIESQNKPIYGTIGWLYRGKGQIHVCWNTQNSHHCVGWIYQWRLNADGGSVDPPASIGTITYLVFSRSQPQRGIVNEIFFPYIRRRRKGAQSHSPLSSSHPSS
jgi:hypothetical protein